MQIICLYKSSKVDSSKFKWLLKCLWQFKMKMYTFMENGIISILFSGKGAIGAKVGVPKPEQKGRKERKALADLSKAGKPSVFNASTPSLKGKLASRGNESTKNVPKSYILTDEEIKQCNEWAEEGIEHVYFSGNDLNALLKDVEEKRVEKKVEKVMSALSGWTQMAYGQENPLGEADKVSKDFMKLELEPEMLPPLNCSLPISGNEETNDLFPEEHFCLQLYPDIKLKEEYEGDVHCL
ncbi:uncharacterized protein LOC131246363 isoform X1 [Magnolia sinica]|uniref:uncharacterized protein LOC131246363 isoform X1 n=1 Tax=Magnolia sinica TaxID=86752 RepID=UPI00265ADC6B|nr:uncharacterized protein LOC131246363 isoform X1 [Magnolia sinica]